jgi:putative salt-induced outer membrane protein YdiY
MCTYVLAAAPVVAQTASKEPPPVWDAQLGASFVGTSGNSDTSTLGGDFSYHHRSLDWQLESTASAVRTSDHGTLTAEQYVATFRGRRKLRDSVGFSTGIRAERDRLSGVALRTILDAGLSWGLVESRRWTVDGLTSLAWNYEDRLSGPNLSHPIGTLQVLSRVPLGSSGSTTQRLTFYPDLQQASRYRGEAEVTAQAAMNSWLSLRFGYLLRYSNSPVPGFEKTDQTSTAAIVLHWRAATPAPHR